jgi:formylglycine-generating enzyme required for sulfatase activity
MPRCPVCETRYKSSQDLHCPVCDWDLQAHHFLIGLMPEVAQKENTRLAWARRVWSAFRAKNEQLQTVQQQLKDRQQAMQQMQSELDQNRNEQTRLAEAANQQDARFGQLQDQLNQANDAVTQLRWELNQLRQTSTFQSPSELQSLISTVDSLPAINLQPFSFQVITLDTKGQIINQTLETAQYFRENLGAGLALDMIWIPGGSFWMGSPETEVGRDAHESPQHAVTLQSFCLGRFPITQAQWHAIAQLPQVQRPLNLDPSNFKGKDLPVDQVSWHDAVEYCARLAHHSQRSYRLPTEAEWEYACRAGTASPFNVGDTITSDWANYDGSYAYAEELEGHYWQRTTPMEKFSIANAFGVSDMHGNVWEWCADSWHDDYQDAPMNGSSWQSEESESRRVLRGGAWYCLPSLCRSAQRHWDHVDQGGSGTSFRVACTVSQRLGNSNS